MKETRLEEYKTEEGNETEIITVQGKEGPICHSKLQTYISYSVFH